MLISQLLFHNFLISLYYNCIWYFKRGCNQKG